MKSPINLFWFRRDLRLDNNAGLWHALRDELPVQPLFIFDRAILDELEDKTDGRVSFINQAISALQQQLVKLGSSLDVRYGRVEEVWLDLLGEYQIKKVYTNHDYDPYAIKRDQQVAAMLRQQKVAFVSYKDQVIFEKDEVVKDDGKPYTVFTPFSRKWKAKFQDTTIETFSCKSLFSRFLQRQPANNPSLSEIGFVPTSLQFPSKRIDVSLISQYDRQRDFPAVEGTSRLGVHLRFGTISVRELVKQAVAGNDIFLIELIWREFYQLILWHFPQVVHQSFKPEYDAIQWRNNEKEFNAWCRGNTGYPIVDAGMRELNATGYMHNRLRMITASFLTKHLLVDWRWGEAYFAGKLLDYELASNNGGWQWAAGCGCDAAPYFRIFNPYLQTRKFDPELKYIRKWVPEFEGFGYATPVVAHELARERCLQVYGKALKRK